MAERDPYAAPRRGDSGGPLIRWTVILALGAASVAFGRHLAADEPNRAEATHLQQAASPQFPEPPMAGDAPDLDASGANENISADAPPEPEAPTHEAAMHSGQRRGRPVAEPQSESIPPPVGSFPATPTAGAEPLPLSGAFPSAEQALVADPPPLSEGSFPAPPPAAEPPGPP
jgi:hypothetical protein